MQKRKHAVAPLQPGNGSCLPIPERFAIESIRSGPCVLTPPSEIDAASELRLLRWRGFSLALLNSVEHFMSEMLQAFAIFQAAFRYSRGRLSASLKVSIHNRPIRRLTPRPKDSGRAACPSPERFALESICQSGPDIPARRFHAAGAVRRK